MIAMLDIGAIDGVLQMHDAIDLLEKTLRHEASGATSVSPKFTTDFAEGSMRVLFASVRESVSMSASSSAMRLALSARSSRSALRKSLRCMSRSLSG